MASWHNHRLPQPWSKNGHQDAEQMQTWALCSSKQQDEGSNTQTSCLVFQLGKAFLFAIYVVRSGLSAVLWPSHWGSQIWVVRSSVPPSLALEMQTCRHLVAEQGCCAWAQVCWLALPCTFALMKSGTWWQRCRMDRGRLGGVRGLGRGAGGCEKRLNAPEYAPLLHRTSLTNQRQN